MPDNETIARLGVELYSDSEAFFDNLASDFTAAFTQIKGEVEQAIEEINATIIAGMSGEQLGQRVAGIWAGVGEGSKEAIALIEGIAEASGKSVEEINSLGQAYTENLRDRLVEALQAANAELTATNTLSSETVGNLKALSDEAGKVAALDKDLAAGAVAARNLAEQYGKVTKSTEDMNVATALANKALGTTGLTIQSITSGVAVATIVWKGFTAVMNELNTSVALVARLSEVNFRLEVSARAAQRALGEQAMSIKEAKGFASELADTYGQSIVATTALTAKAIQMTMEMGFSKDRVKELTEAAVVLNETIGMDSMSALMQITMFIQTGYGRALARQGFDVTRATQQQEAYRLGINKTLKEMSEAEKQQVRTSLIMRQANKFAEDAVAGQNNYAKAMAHANRNLETQREELGKLLLPMKGMLEGLKIWFTTKFVEALTAGFQLIILAVSFLAGRWVAAWKMVEDALNGNLQSFRYYVDYAHEYMKKMAVDADKWVNALGDAFGEGGAAAEDFATQVAMAMGEAEEMFGDSLEKFGEDATKLKDKLDDAIGDIWENYRKRYEQGEIDLAREIRDIDEDAAEQRLETIEEYQVEEIRMRQDHERALRDLENQYLLDLMDAVRERDARQVLMLQRRYNLERQKQEDEFRVNQRRRKEDFERELREIAEQAARKKWERERAFREEMADLERQSIERRKELEAQYQEDLQALKDDIIKAGADIIQQLLAAGYKPEVVLEVAKRLGESIGQQLGASAATDFMTTITPYISAAFTAAAKAVAIFKTLAKVGVTKNVPGIGNVTSSVSVTPSGYAPYTSPGSRRRIEGFQFGGDFVATSPQDIRVGERPERVTISPLNEGTGAPRAGYAGGGAGRAKVGVAITLSPGLEGQIVEQTMSEVADVLVSLSRETASRPLGGSRG